MKQPKKVEIFHRINKLKKKVAQHGASGFINPEHIKNAQNIIENGQEAYQKEILVALEDLNQSWESARNASASDTQAHLDTIHKLTNHIKDLASMYEYKLMEYFGHSLRSFSKNFDSRNKAHQTIVQAHIDVMWVAYKQNIKDEGGETAKELKLIVGKAIEKYSTEE